MRKGPVREKLKAARIALLLKGMARAFPRFNSIAQMANYLFDSIPLEFHYLRSERQAHLTIGVELERLIGSRAPLQEEIYVPYQIVMKLRDVQTASHLESFIFTNGPGSGQELRITNIQSVKSFRKQGLNGLWLPPKGYVVHLTGLDFLCVVEKLSDISVKLDKHALSSAYVGDRTAFDSLTQRPMALRSILDHRSTAKS